MEFVDNTGHIFSLPSYKEKPIGYEYDERSYIFWIDGVTSKLSVNNFYSRPIYALYMMNKDYDISLLSDNVNSPVQISIEIENSNIYKLIDSNKFNNYISSDKYNDMNDYIDLGELETETSYLKSKLTNEDLFVIKTTETVNNTKTLQSVDFDYLMIPIYPIACAKEEGTWISNIMIHIYDSDKDLHEWCPISVGGEFINEYEELIINERNIGVNLPKDILKAVYRESIYNEEFNESLFNEKIKEYLINKTIIRSECGNFNSAIASLKWFGFGPHLSISKLLKTDNDLLNQYLLDYFNIKNDIIDVFKLFKSSALVSLKLMINKELDELYPFIYDESNFFGENKPKMLSLLDYYKKIKIGNHDMPIEDDDEKYWYWKPYFDFSFLELGIKLACLKIFYKKYFLPLHLYVHDASLGYRVFANDIKYTITSGVAMSEPTIALNGKDSEVEFCDYNIHYYSQQVHYIDNNFNEFTMHNINDDKRTVYEMNDTCINIPITFKNGEDGYFNCVLLLLNENISKEPLLEEHFSFYQHKGYVYKNFILYPKKINIKISGKIEDESINIESKYFEYWINDGFILKLLVNNRWYEYRFETRIHNPTIDFGTLRYRYYLNEHNYLLSRIMNKDINIHSFIFTDKIDNIKSEYDVDRLYDLTDINDENRLLYYICGITNSSDSTSFIKTVDISGEYKYSYSDSEQQEAYEKDYEFWNLSSDNNKEKIYQYFESNYNILSPFTQLSRLDHINKRVSFNAYMHNSELINVNNINYDIDFYKILKYHLEHNLMYIDGTLVNRDFYQYILYPFEGRYVEVLIHKDMIGSDIEIPMNYFNRDKVLVCAWDDTMYILEETGDDSENYYINMIHTNNAIFMSEDDSYAMILNSLHLRYDRSTNSYWAIDELTGAALEQFLIYDKLYSNVDYVYGKYSSLVNLSNLDKYKNSLHLFNIYTREPHRQNILIFHNDIDLYINGLRWQHGKFDIDIDPNDPRVERDSEYESLKIYISGKPGDDAINTRTLDVYGLHLIQGKIEDGKIRNVPVEIRMHNYEYGIYVKRDYRRYYEPETEDERISKIYELENIFEYDVNEFSYYIEQGINNDPNLGYTKIGYLYFKTIDDFYDNNYYKCIFEDNYKDVELIKEDESYYFYDLETKDLTDLSKYYKNEIYYKIKFYNEANVEINVSLNNIYDIAYDHVKIELYYRKHHIVRNRFYLLVDYLNEYTEKGYNFEFVNEQTLRMYNNNMSIDIPLIKLSPKYMYIDDDHAVSNQNPAYYWLNVDNNSIVSLPSYLNELERFAYNGENETTDDIFTMLDKYKEKFNTVKSYIDNPLRENKKNAELAELDFEEARYRYINYLSKDFTGKKGIFKLVLESNFITDFTVRLTLEIIDKDGNIINYTNKDSNFELYGDEQKVTLYIQLDDLSIGSHVNNWIMCRMDEITDVDIPLEYKYEEHGNDHILTRVLNKDYYYGDNISKNTYDLYNDFFDLKFNIYDTYIKYDEESMKRKAYCTLLNSVYEANKNIQLSNMYLDYDFYLMHDDKYWYGLYISRQTCNLIKKLNDLNIPNEYKTMSLFSKDGETNYILKHHISSKEYLINRLEFMSSWGMNQFKDDDIVACYVHNNIRLPFNPYISSKWSISPMSLGMTTDSKFESNAEMTILSIPKNDNKYQKGYYKATVKYSLDRDIQHQFKNTSTLLIS